MKIATKHFINGLILLVTGVMAFSLALRYGTLLIDAMERPTRRLAIRLLEEAGNPNDRSLLRSDSNDDLTVAFIIALLGAGAGIAFTKSFSELLKSKTSSKHVKPS